MRSGMLRYARYQAGDFLLQKASVPAILALFIGGLTVYLASHRSVPIDWSAPLGADNARAVLKQALDLFVPLAAFLAVNGISSGDRQRGYVRFLFAKPIVVPAYYVQTWLVYGGMLALLAGALTMLLQLFTTALPVGGAMAAAALTWILLGGLGFMLSTLTRRDGALVILVWMLASLLRAAAAMQPESPLPSWMLPVVKLLPPADRLDAVRTALYGVHAVDTAAVLHVVAYGLSCLAVGTFVLRRRSLIT